MTAALLAVAFGVTVGYQTGYQAVAEDVYEILPEDSGVAEESIGSSTPAESEPADPGIPGIQSAEDTPTQEKTVLYLYNPEYPPTEAVQYPPSAERVTRFWQLLDKEFASTDLTLTSNIEEADYRVELKCTGVPYCTRLRVYILTPQRDVLSSYSIGAGRMFLVAGTPMISRVAARLSETLQEHIDLLGKGGFGYR